jgi:hypothetical protein
MMTELPMPVDIAVDGETSYAAPNKVMIDKTAQEQKERQWLVVSLRDWVIAFHSSWWIAVRGGMDNICGFDASTICEECSTFSLAFLEVSRSI